MCIMICKAIFFKHFTYYLLFPVTLQERLRV